MLLSALFETLETFCKRRHGDPVNHGDQYDVCPGDKQKSRALHPVILASTEHMQPLQKPTQSKSPPTHSHSESHFLITRSCFLSGPYPSCHFVKSFRIHFLILYFQVRNQFVSVATVCTEFSVSLKIHRYRCFLLHCSLESIHISLDLAYIFHSLRQNFGCFQV